MATHKERNTSLKKKVFIVDDHPVVCDGLTSVINRQNDFSVCGDAPDIPEAMQGIRKNKPDIVLVDITLGKSNGLRLIEDLSDQFPDMAVLTLSMHDESIYAERCLKAGSKGYIMKQEPPAMIISAMREVMKGEIYISSGLGRQMLTRFVTKQSGIYSSPIEILSNRELEIFEQIGKGLKTKDIASQMNISFKTVESYIDRIKKKMKFKDSRILFLRAVQWLLSDDISN